MEHLIKPEFGLTFWTILTFIILVLVLSKFVWKPVLKAVEDRENKINSDIESAKKARDEAEKMKEEIENRIKSLNSEIEQRISKAVYDANLEREKIIEKAQNQAELIISNAKKEVELYKKEIERELEKKLIETSVLISKRVLSDIVDKKLDEKIAEASLREYKTRFSKN